MNEAEHRHVETEEDAEQPEPGEVLVAPSGNIVIGAPVPVVVVEAPQPGGEG